MKKMKMPIFLFSVMLVISGCFSLSGTRVTPMVDGNLLKFYLHYGNANGLLGASLALDGSNTAVWRQGYNYFRGDSLEYGKLAPELFNKQLVLTMTWQYDNFMGPSIASEQYEFFVTRDGAVAGLKKRE